MAELSSPLLYADSERSADVLYFGQVDIPDPFIAFGRRGKKYAVVSALEFGRVKRTSEFDVVLPLEDWVKRTKEARPRQSAGVADIIAQLARTYQIRSFRVPNDFPAGLYQRLRKLGVKVEPESGSLFFPEREIKTAAEAAGIREGNRASSAGFAAAEKVLRESKARNGRLYHRGNVLTSERLKFAIESACLEAGAVSSGTICAGGDQACDPHERGSGPLRANELIILDIFPRVTATGYYGDMTRTFLRGRASDVQKAIVAAVRAAQLAALKHIRAGVNGREVHAAAAQVFVDRGFETKTTAQGSVGFFHGTGHGLGLEIHEPPRMSPSADIKLKAGTVVTVEPGLYYPGIGGCRIEDVVQVTAKAPRFLSSYHYDWELR
ncbi:MAG TPA: Xaa-Pro peptidase family protein [Opitutaceae bacterium]|jgi:Xaa-Pro aminopeptidase